MCDENWNKPLKWNEQDWVECKVCGWREQTKVAVQAGLSNMCPCRENNLRNVRQRVFCGSLCDVFEDNRDVANWRGELFELIEQTPNLDWLLLTKRPENIFSLGTDAVGEVFDNWLARNPHVWLGATIEMQDVAKDRVLELQKLCANVMFLSLEPMLEPIDLCVGDPRLPAPDWVIVGGESGSNHRHR